MVTGNSIESASYSQIWKVGCHGLCDYNGGMDDGVVEKAYIKQDIERIKRTHIVGDDGEEENDK